MMGSGEVGRNITFGFVNETAYNEAWGTPTLTGVYISPDIDVAVSLNHMRELHAHGLPMLKVNDVVPGVKNSTIRVSGKLPKENLGWLLVSLFGKTTNTLVSGFQNHIFYPGLTHDPVSLKAQVGNSIYTNAGVETENSANLRGVKVRSIEFVLETNKPIIWTAELVCGSWDLVATGETVTVPVSASGNPFWFFNETLNSLSLGSVTGFASGTIRFEQILADAEEDGYDWGSDERVRLYRGAAEDVFKAQVTLRRLIQSTDLPIAFEGFTDQAFLASVGVTTDYFWKVNLPKTKITDYRKVNRGLGLVQEELTAEAILTSAISEVYIQYNDKQTAPATQGF